MWLTLDVKDKMKFILGLIICSSVYNSCLPTYEWPEKFNSHYECMIFGYEESIKKAKEIGSKDVNKYGTIIKFFCMNENDSPSEKKGHLTS